MAGKDILKHGFKAKAERLASSFRQELNLAIRSPLCAFDLAQHLKISIYEATAFLNEPTEIERLSGTGDKDCGWSALTMKTKANNTIIIHNPYHSSARQQSNLMHELAHIICGHTIKGLEKSFALPIGMRHFDEVQEEEAKCLGATLQLTRPGLLWSLQSGMDEQAIASYFNASSEMVTYRIRMTGVLKQISYKRKFF